MRNVPEDQMQPFMLAEAPRLIFPFARRVLADAIRDGGFPPLLLDPIDFGGLYIQQAEERGSASCRERACHVVEISVVAVTLKIQHNYCSRQYILISKYIH